MNTRITARRAAVFAVAIAVTAAAPAQTRPGWTAATGVSASAAAVVSVSSGADRKTAETQALAQLTAYFRQSVTTSVTLRDTAVEGGPWRSEAEQIITAVSALDALDGVETEAWQDAPRGLWYARAALDKARGRAGYAALLDAVLAQAAAALAVPDPGAFAALSAARGAAVLAGRADAYAAVLALLDGPDRQADVAALNARAAAVTAAFFDAPIALRIQGDAGGRITNACNQALTAEGFRSAAPAAARARYALEAEVTYSPLGQRDRYYETRYLVDAAFVDTRDGAALFRFTVSGRELHPSSQAAADTRAEASAEKKAREEFSKRLRERLGR